MRHLTLITTGGTIEKTYDESTGELTNRRTIVRRMLKRLRLEDTDVSIIELMSKDSLHLTPDDRDAIVKALDACGADKPESRHARRSTSTTIGAASASERGSSSPPVTPTQPRGVVILHGTDTLAVTGEYILEHLKPIAVPIVLTGAMRPFEMTRSDALQNLTEAIFAAGLLPPGVFCVAHGRMLQFPGVQKDRKRRTFVKSS